MSVLPVCTSVWLPGACLRLTSILCSDCDAGTNVTVEDAQDAMVINRGMYDEDRRQGRIKISGFVRQESGGWLRFDETFVENAWLVREVTTALLEVGFSAVYQACATDLAVPLADPESEPRVFFVARA